MKLMKLTWNLLFAVVFGFWAYAQYVREAHTTLNFWMLVLFVFTSVLSLRDASMALEQWLDDRLEQLAAERRALEQQLNRIEAENIAGPR